jgi:hypothetical protein
MVISALYVHVGLEHSDTHRKAGKAGSMGQEVDAGNGS